MITHSPHLKPHAAHNPVQAEYTTLPAENLLLVPEELTDQEACFAEPLAAACRIPEQQVRASERAGWAWVLVSSSTALLMV